MAFLDSVDFQTIQEKTHRVRSWYLYEQYKTLEKNQLDATKKLKNKWYQDRLLHRELSERRSRRQVCGEFGTAQSESGIDSINSDITFITSSDDFFETFSDHRPKVSTVIPLHYEEEYEHETASNATGDTGFTFQENYHDEDAEARNFECNAPSVIDVKLKEGKVECDTTPPTEGQEYGDVEKNHSSLDNKVPQPECKTEMSVSSLTDEPQPQLQIDSSRTIISANENSANEVENELELVKLSIAENIHLHFETVRENLECLQNYSKLIEDSIGDESLESESSFEDKSDTSYDGGSVISMPTMPIANLSTKANNDSNSVLSLWSKIVSFAYQVIQLNHGNFYYDYSSQFLTAVLACDVVWRGVNRMCRILQPYVSPIQFSSNKPMTDTSLNKTIATIGKFSNIKKPNKMSVFKRKNKFRGVKKCYKKSPSATISCGAKYRGNLSLDDRGMTKKRHVSEPWRNLSRMYPCFTPYRERVPSAIWPEEMNTSYTEDLPRVRITNPMLKLATYIDTILRDFESES